MRKILFKGKRKDNGEWIEGYFGVFVGIPQIYVPFTEEQKKENEGHIFSQIGGLWYEVIPETVGQFTGMTDKNGKMIFEGDIISFTRYNALGYITSRIGKVCYGEDYPAFYIEATTGDTWCFSEIEDIKVIGNIHDNLELMKGE